MSEIEHRLRSERPVPAPTWRGDLRRRLVGLERSGYTEPRGLRLLIAAYAGSGAALLAFSLIGVLGTGPLAA